MSILAKALISSGYKYGYGNNLSEYKDMTNLFAMSIWITKKIHLSKSKPYTQKCRPLKTIGGIGFIRNIFLFYKRKMFGVPGRITRLRRSFPLRCGFMLRIRLSFVFRLAFISRSVNTALPSSPTGRGHFVFFSVRILFFLFWRTRIRTSDLWSRSPTLLN